MKKCRPVVKGPSGDKLLFRFALPARGASMISISSMSALPLCLGAACTGCIVPGDPGLSRSAPLPRRCLHGVHPHHAQENGFPYPFASALPARGASLHRPCTLRPAPFASALPARGASQLGRGVCIWESLCLGAACTGCIGKSRQIAAHHFVAYAVSR